MSEIQFNLKTQAFNLPNAYFLAQLSALVYQPLNQIAGTLEKEYGLTKYKSYDIKDTQGFITANKDIIVLVFRGTTTGIDWLTNVKFVLVPSNVGKVHYGFNAGLNLVWEDVYDTVMSWKEKEQTFWATGHSLGGALATLAVDRFTEENVELVSGLYTFGSPRVGDSAFAANFDRKMKRFTFRFVDDQDIITKVPLPPGYSHVGNEYFFDRDGTMHKEGLFWSWFKSASESVYLRSINVDGGVQIKPNNPGGIRDHSANYYVRYLDQNLKKQKKFFKDYINN